MNALDALATWRERRFQRKRRQALARSFVVVAWDAEMVYGPFVTMEAADLAAHEYTRLHNGVEVMSEARFRERLSAKFSYLGGKA